MDTLPTFEGTRWLNDLIEYSVSANVCTSWGCTTCGAMQFRSAIIQSARAAVGEDNLDVDEEVARQLNRVDVKAETFHAVRFVILFLYYVCGRSSDFENSILRHFDSSPAGAVYRSMVTHHAALVASRDPASKARAAEARAQHKRNELHARQARKREVDAAWLARGKKPPNPSNAKGESKP